MVGTGIFDIGLGTKGDNDVHRNGMSAMFRKKTIIDPVFW